MCITMANIFAVPGTGKRATGHYFRRPRNIAVKRQILGSSETLRGIAVPPDSYNDIPIAANCDRTWKRHRTTQYRETAP